MLALVRHASLTLASQMLLLSLVDANATPRRQLNEIDEGSPYRETCSPMREGAFGDDFDYSSCKFDAPAGSLCALTCKSDYESLCTFRCDQQYGGTRWISFPTSCSCPSECKKKIANSNNEGIQCKGSRAVGYISYGFSCDVDYAPFPTDSDTVTRCLEDPCNQGDIPSLNVICKPVYNSTTRAFSPVLIGCQRGSLPVVSFETGEFILCQADPCYTSTCAPGFVCTNTYDIDNERWRAVCSVAAQAPCLLRFDGSISNASVIIGNGEGGGCGYKNQDISTSARPVTLSETGDIFSAFQNANCSLAAAKGATCTLQAPNGTTIATFGDSKPYTFCEVDPSTEEIVGGIVIKPATNPFVYQPLTISCQ